MYTRPVLADFSHLDALLVELNGFRPLPPDVTRKLTEKLRLDWNYHSNALEGNTLTYGETKALLLADRYVGNKEGRHYREISAHNDVLKTLDELVNVDKDRALTEGLIRDLHKQMLKEAYYSYAETMEGQSIQKRIVPGEYKQQPNSVRRSTGEMFYYAEPFEVSAKMQELLEAYRQMNAELTIHPVALAAWFHYEFIRIHPFDDGNGRLARILMNLILQRRGLVPAIVRVEDKTPYIDALAVADGTDDLTEFTRFIAKQVERIVVLTVRAARGEDISEPGDWKKELQIMNQNTPKPDKSFEFAGSYNLSLFVQNIIYALDEIKKFYEEKLYTVQIDAELRHPNKTRKTYTFHQFVRDHLSSSYTYEKNTEMAFELVVKKGKDMAADVLIFRFGEYGIDASFGNSTKIFKYGQEVEQVKAPIISQFIGSELNSLLKKS